MRKETAVLLALFQHKENQEGFVHKSYVREKILVVLEHGAGPEILDTINRRKYEELIGGQEA